MRALIQHRYSFVISDACNVYKRNGILLNRRLPTFWNGLNRSPGTRYDTRFRLWRCLRPLLLRVSQGTAADPHTSFSEWHAAVSQVTIPRFCVQGLTDALQTWQTVPEPALPACWLRAALWGRVNPATPKCGRHRQNAPRETCSWPRFASGSTAHAVRAETPAISLLASVSNLLLEGAPGRKPDPGSG